MKPRYVNPHLPATPYRPHPPKVTGRGLLVLIATAVLLFCIAYALTGCSVVSCDRVFPKITWYWSDEAKRCRAEHQPAKAEPKKSSMAVPVWHTNNLAIIYPATLNPENFQCTVQTSKDLVTWTEKTSMRQGSDIVVEANGALEFYRLKGTAHP